MRASGPFLRSTTASAPRTWAAFKLGCVLALAGLMTLGIAAPARAADEGVENKIRAAILYNIAVFVKWPPSTFADDDSPLLFCAVQAEALAAEMEFGLRNRTVNGRPVQVVPLTDATDLRSCHLAYLGERDPAKILAILRETIGQPMLTVHESERVAKGGVIRFLRDDQKLRFEINDAAASRNHLEISPKLLKLAIVVSEW